MTPILKNKWFLYVTEFFAGMSVMAVELGASRLLAPYFSSSQIVWTIIIGAIMIAMALGNIYGGRAADKDPNPDRLYTRILIAAAWIAAIPAVGKYVVLGISALLIFTVNTHFLIWAAFAACMALFVFPLFLLGTVTPSLAKYTVQSLSDSGSTVGMLNASNTIGSIIGTFVPTFLSIPAVGTSVTFLIFAAILLALSLLYFLSKKSGAKKCGAAVLLFLLCCGFGRSGSFAFWERGLAYEGESVYNYLQVKETDTSVILSTNVLFGVQSILPKTPGPTGMYYDYAMAAPLMTEKENPADCDTLILGMGTGTYARQCLSYYGDMALEGVEIDEKITALARKYFDLPETVKVTTYDGRAYLNAVDKKYDVILVDAYQDITIPFQMSSVEFFTLVKEHLTENGVMAVNMNMKGGGADGINAYLSDTIASVFGQVYTVDVPGATNRELFASDNPNMLQNLASRLGPAADGDDSRQEDAPPAFDGKTFQQEDTSLANVGKASHLIQEEESAGAPAFDDNNSQIQEEKHAGAKEGAAQQTAQKNKAALTDESLLAMMNQVLNGLRAYEAGNRIMTDDKAPVELLGMRVIDELIRGEVAYYKDIYEKQGIQGVLDAL